MEMSTTAIGQRRRNTSEAPARTPNATPTPVGTPVSPENVIPSAPHSAAEANASPTSNTALRRRSHHHGPVTAALRFSPVVVMPSSLRATSPPFPASFRLSDRTHALFDAKRNGQKSLELLNRPRSRPDARIPDEGREGPRTVRKNTGDGYHGCLMIYVRQSDDLYRRMEGAWYGIVLGAETAT
ncbi:hypothetical protein GCM10010449_37540 [Streptomyces rectiviolaceus]|uniref:Uncharacterized protein n=1 Tax=Streptomyces rectiviolaceus TaxID=332591 RepID=A0ABP6MK88_9ACTN